MTNPAARRTIFVFGSNLQGIHGAGAAREARKKWGAVWNRGHGFAGNSYALPTKRTPYETLARAEVGDHVEVFLLVAAWCAHYDFLVTRVGCGLAGFTDSQIAPFFAEAPRNCILPIQWKAWCDAPGRRWHDEGKILTEVTP